MYSRIIGSTDEIHYSTDFNVDKNKTITIKKGRFILLFAVYKYIIYIRNAYSWFCVLYYLYLYIICIFLCQELNELHLIWLNIILSVGKIILNI